MTQVTLRRKRVRVTTLGVGVLGEMACSLGCPPATAALVVDVLTDPAGRVPVARGVEARHDLSRRLKESDGEFPFKVLLPAPHLFALLGLRRDGVCRARAHHCARQWLMYAYPAHVFVCCASTESSSSAASSRAIVSRTSSLRTTSGTLLLHWGRVQVRRWREPRLEVLRRVEVRRRHLEGWWLEACRTREGCLRRL